MLKSSFPFFSIIIPTHNRPEQLAVCLESLACQDYPRDHFEVIAVDDGGHEALESVLASHCKESRVRLIRQDNGGPAAARNTGALNATGDVLAFIDDDCTASENWLSSIAERLAYMPDSIVGGRIACVSSANIYALTSQMIIDMVYEHYNRNPEHAHFFTTCNMAVPADMFHSLGGFDTSFRVSEDREFCDRWQAQHGSMRYAEHAVVYHDDYVASLGSFIQRYFNYGRGAYRYHKIRSVRRSGDIKCEMKFHSNLWNWLFYPFGRYTVTRALMMAWMLLVWQVSNATGWVYEAMTQKLKGKANGISDRQETA